jgi:DNA-binding NarL/FixJ family response regulator
MRKVRLLVIDGHEVVRIGIRALIATHSGWMICGEAKSALEGLRKIKRLKPDVVILEVKLIDRNGLLVVQEMRARYPDIEVLILTTEDSPQVAAAVLAAGVRGMVFKSDSAKDLLNGVRLVSKHRPFLSPLVTQVVMRSGLSAAGAQPTLDLLTPREREILKEIAEGRNAKEIAANLEISPKTVNVHRANVMEKLQLRSLTELIYFAVRNKIVSVS